MYTKNDRFDMQDFLTPDRDFAPIYAWVWNSVCTRDVIDQELAEMARLGIRAVYIIPEPREFRPDSMPTELAPDYLSPEYLALYAYAMRRAGELGMLCWLYDEGGWPSGGACGKVLKDHPEYAREVLRAKSREFSAGAVYRKGSEDILGAFLPDGTQIEEGCVFAEDTVATEYFVRQETYGAADFPDLLSRNATEHFLNITHDRYASVLSEELGKHITAVFTDEPKAPHRAFRRELRDAYEARFGESVLPHMPLLAGKVPVTEENIHVLYRWYDLCSRLFCENFLLPCKVWANAHHMAFTGHMDVDHDPVGCMRGCNYHLMRALRCLDIPGIDVIWRQIYPEGDAGRDPDRNGYNGFFPRYASSAAAQIGTGRAMTESLGVFGPGLTYDNMRYCLGYQAVRGINIFNLMTISLGRSNARLAQVLPSFTEDQIYYRELPAFNRYAERLSYLSSLGERVCDTALYYPVQDFWGKLHAESVAEAYDALGRALEDRPVDFDIVDDDVLQAAEGVDSGCFRVGLASYRHIFIPRGAHLPPETARVLERFVLAGGKVSHSAEEAVPVLQTEGCTRGLRAMRRKIAGGDLLILFREAGDTDSYTVHVPEGRVCRLLAETGEVRTVPTEGGCARISLALGETAVLCVTDELLPAADAPEYAAEHELSGDFSFCRTLGLIYGAERLENTEFCEDARPLPLGDWAPRVGIAYSGSGLYRTTFRLSAEDAGRAAALDLGDVRYTASVRLNGRELGTALMPPYRFPIPEGLLLEENLLEITVTNTPANQFVHTDFFDKWEIRQLSSYFERERKLAEDSVSGGLYGPVKLLWRCK